MAEPDKEFVENVVKAIVDHPDDVKTKRSVDEMGVLIELTVHPEDMGKIIGKEGRTAKSIRTLLRVLGAKNNARVNLKIVEPEGGRVEPEGGREVKTTEEKAPKEEKATK
ncbi:KH domain-containing protein, partial [Patescibacteria group bacterium]|nr:KH domain-containing protein [Patescibacteria group bacterium]